MGESPSTPWHSLHQSDPKSIEGDCHLHDRVLRAIVTGPQQHHIVVVVEFAVGDSDSSGALDYIDQAVSGLRQGHVARTEHNDGVALTLGPQPHVIGGISDRPAGGRVSKYCV